MVRPLNWVKTLIFILVVFVAVGVVVYAVHTTSYTELGPALPFWTSVAVLVVAECTPIHTGQARFRFRMAAHIPLLLFYGLLPILIAELIVLTTQHLLTVAMKQRLEIYYPRVFAALLAPTVAAVVYHYLVGTVHLSTARSFTVLLGTILAYYVVSFLISLVPGPRLVTHPWQPPRGWLAVLIGLDVLMAAGSVLEQSVNHQIVSISTSLQVFALMLCVYLYVDVSIRRTRMVNLSKLMGNLARHTSLSEISADLFLGLEELLDVDAAVIWALADDHALHPLYIQSYCATDPLARHLHLYRPPIAVGVGLEGFAAASREIAYRSPLLVVEPLASADVPAMYGSAIAAPIVVEGDVFGVLSLYYRRSMNVFRKRERELVEFVCNQLGGILNHLWRYEQIKLNSHLDELTGLYNYRYFESALHHEVETANATGQPLTLLILDIDYFKQVNDTYGHLAGNQVLQTLAQLLREMVRESDVLARYGGEEFTILLPGLGAAEAETVAERIRRRVEAADFAVDHALATTTLSRRSVANVQAASANQVVLRLTVSIGIATYPDVSDSAMALLRHADRAMYIGSKQSGRNRVSVYG